MKIIAEKSRIDDIADAVRQKLNVETQYKLSEIPAAINTIYVGGELEPLNVTANGDYYPETGVEGFNEVHVAVPNTYAAGDEDKVVHNGELIAQTARSTPITQNGTYSTVLNSEVEVNVSGGGGATLVSKSINANGTYDPASDNADGYSAVTVSVPNTYAASDEGKVVSNGTLVAQGSDTVTQNGTVDTTLISSLIVSVSGGGGTMQSKTVTPGASQQVVQPDSGYAGLSFVTVEGDADLVAGNIKKDVEIFGVTGNYEGGGGGGAVVQPLSVTQNGTYNPPSGVDGFSPVTVNVSGGSTEPTSITTLWESANYNQNITNIPLSDSANNYKYLLIGCCYTNFSANFTSFLLPIVGFTVERYPLAILNKYEPPQTQTTLLIEADCKFRVLIDGNQCVISEQNYLRPVLIKGIR